jgi:hypothetical protein
MSEVLEFGFASEMPRKKTKVGLLGQIKEFWQATDGGAIPVPLAAKILNVTPETVVNWIKKDKIRGHRFNKTLLVSVNDVEAMLDAPKDIGGRPKKAV